MFSSSHCDLSVVAEHYAGRVQWCTAHGRIHVEFGIMSLTLDAEEFARIRSVATTYMTASASPSEASGRPPLSFSIESAVPGMRVEITSASVPALVDLLDDAHRTIGLRMMCRTLWE